MTQQRIRTISKVTIARLASGYRSSNALNNDLELIEEAFENTLSRDGTGPNQMEAVLDMNSNRIINLPKPETATEAARLTDVTDNIMAVANLILPTKADTNLGNTAVAVRPGDTPENAAALLRRKYRNYFDPTDPQWGARVGGKTGNASADLATALFNQIAFQACANAFKAAVNSGMRNSVFYVPAKDFLIASAPFAGASPPGLGVSAVGGGHWRGSSNLPLSAGWSCHCIVFDGLTGGRLHCEGGRLIRVENDPYNTGTGADDTNSTVLIARSSDFAVTGRWEQEGFQEGVSHSTTSGNFFDFSYGCRNFAVEGDIWSWKGTNALVVGMNRASGYSAAAGGFAQTGIDISQPCLDWAVSGQIEAYDGEHAVFVAVSDRGYIRRITHRHKDYSYGGVPQGDYVQRTLYLQGCGRIEVGEIEGNVSQKVGLLLSAYPSTRTYKDIDAVIGTIVMTAPQNQGDDFYTAVEINDQNRSMDTLRRISAKIGSLTTRGHKVGIGYRDLDTDSILGTSVLTRFEVEKIDVQSTVAGIAITPYGGASNVKLGSGSIDVRARPEFSATAVPATGLNIVSRKGVLDGIAATDFVNNVTIGQVDVTSGNRTCALQVVNGLQITGANFIYDAQGVPGAQTYDLRIDYCKNYGPISYRLGAGGLATQTTPNETMPNPIKGRFSRSGTINPGTVTAGSSANSALAVVGARSGMSVTVDLVSPPTGLMATASITANDTVTVYVRNVGTASATPGVLNYVINVFSV